MHQFQEAVARALGGDLGPLREMIRQVPGAPVALAPCQRIALEVLLAAWNIELGSKASTRWDKEAARVLAEKHADEAARLLAGARAPVLLGPEETRALLWALGSGMEDLARRIHSTRAMERGGEVEEGDTAAVAHLVETLKALAARLR